MKCCSDKKSFFESVVRRVKKYVCAVVLLQIVFECIIVTAYANNETEIKDLVYEKTMPLEYATEFSVDYYEGGYKLISVTDGRKYLIIPENGTVPEIPDGSVRVLKQPVKNVYLAATSAMALFDALGAMDSLRFSGTRPEGWYIPAAVSKMIDGDIIFAGKYSEPDYEVLLGEDCGLAVESTMILHVPKVGEMLELIGIPVFIDRSGYEMHPLGRTEWIKAYAAVFGLEEKAEMVFNEQAEIVRKLEGFPPTGKKVAFFYLSSDGSVVVRGASDYVASMIKIAGGEYVSCTEKEENSSKASVSVTMEDFYASAADADFLIYNATIENPVSDVDALIEKNELFSTFKAVENGNVWCTGKYLYQATDIIGTMIKDIHSMLTGSNEKMTFISKLQ